MARAKSPAKKAPKKTTKRGVSSSPRRSATPKRSVTPKRSATPVKKAPKKAPAKKVPKQSVSPAKKAPAKKSPAKKSQSKKVKSSKRSASPRQSPAKKGKKSGSKKIGLKLRVPKRHIPKAILKRMFIEQAGEVDGFAQIVRVGKGVAEKLNDSVLSFLRVICEKAQSHMSSQKREMISLEDIDAALECVSRLSEDVVIPHETFKSVVKGILPEKRRVAKDALEMLQRACEEQLKTMMRAACLVVLGRKGVSKVPKDYKSEGQMKHSKNAGKTIATIKESDVKVVAEVQSMTSE